MIANLEFVTADFDEAALFVEAASAMIVDIDAELDMLATPTARFCEGPVGQLGGDAFALPRART